MLHIPFFVFFFFEAMFGKTIVCGHCYVLWYMTVLTHSRAEAHAIRLYRHRPESEDCMACLSALVAPPIPMVTCHIFIRFSSGHFSLPTLWFTIFINYTSWMVVAIVFDLCRYLSPSAHTKQYNAGEETVHHITLSASRASFPHCLCLSACVIPISISSSCFVSVICIFYNNLQF